MTASRKRIQQRLTVLALLIGLATTACAGRTAQQVGQGGDRNTIASAEIEATQAATAYELIRKLRPQFLIGRGSLSLDPQRNASADVGSSSPRVYVDDQLYGDVTALRGIIPGIIESVHFYPGSAAQQRYGHDNAAGVIAIATKH